MHEINFYCKNCKRSLHITYQVTGNGDALVLPNVLIKCTHCKRVICLKKYTEKQILERAVGDKVYI
jgi:hypothetical protein